MSRSAKDLLVLGPHDHAVWVGQGSLKGKSGRHEVSQIYVAIHQSQTSLADDRETWTHVYRVVNDGLSLRDVVYLEAVLQGESLRQGLQRAKSLLAESHDVGGLIGNS
ncbi:hypothetical protein [Microvirga puerhi]|uniref:Uncharacterized protein n=1 Tax=Microvirga puerhi TaxID=2876078 RepID=A0ABS7VTW8_9HYPH|nr:hypothetical protein [Microvirga puerhi]MBZ6078495.1 hypothetical protein [Microvirga puerhi]